MQKISIGILGYNEEFGIGQLLQSMRSQTLFQPDSRFWQHYRIAITVISNGSTDRMAAVARTHLKELASLGIETQVVELPIADKCNAWNYFVHRAAAHSDYYILLDADVVLISADGLADLITRLERNPKARLCAGKVIDHKGNLVPRKLDGKCYAGRGEILQQIAIPDGIVMDDAYVVATAITNWYETDFETGEQREYFISAEQPAVQSGKTPRDRNLTYWLSCRKRTIIGGYVQEQLDFCMRSLFGGGDAARLISMQLFQTNPHWFSQFLSKKTDRPPFNPSSVFQSTPLKSLMQLGVYCYCYLLSLRGIWENEFGHRAWKLKSRYW
ncbi:glycosyltransferase [Leptolyngbya ohadii]|uniref:glycosyltransferase n=1 Tax=Leptolyngbya ohadii TaxID=1962290 RepID=UPI000B59C978|nr:glycosyltransferase [Leptolyngbya ohadii]